MKVKFLSDGGYDTPGIIGEVVEATYYNKARGSVDVKLSDLAPLDEAWQEELDMPTDPDYTFYFRAHEVEVVEE